jgi:hypothetical protein
VLRVLHHSTTINIKGNSYRPKGAGFSCGQGFGSPPISGFLAEFDEDSPHALRLKEGDGHPVQPDSRLLPLSCRALGLCFLKRCLCGGPGSGLHPAQSVDIQEARVVL